jgi:hypothetical protein
MPENQRLSRRQALGALAATTATIPVSCSQPAPTATEDAPAFALIGDRYHNSDYIRTALTRTIVKEMDLAVDFNDDVTALKAANLGGRKLLIILRDGFIWPNGYEGQGTYHNWVGGGRPEIVSVPPVPDTNPERVPFMTTEQGQAVQDFVRNGGGALLMHNVTYIARDNPEFRDVLGAVTQGHPPIRPFKVKIENAEHPITRGLDDFVVTDEQHYMTYEKDPKYVLLRSVNEDGLDFKNLGPSCEAGWAYDYGEGRVCYLAPGHMIVNLWNPTYVKIQQNAVRWLLREA